MGEVVCSNNGKKSKVVVGVEVVAENGDSIVVFFVDAVVSGDVVPVSNVTAEVSESNITAEVSAKGGVIKVVDNDDDGKYFAVVDVESVVVVGYVVGVASVVIVVLTGRDDDVIGRVVIAVENVTSCNDVCFTGAVVARATEVVLACIKTNTCRIIYIND